MKILKILGAAACCTVLASCATGSDTRKLGNMLSDITEQNGRACVSVSDIGAYGVLKDNIVSIEADREHYLATIAPECDELTSSARIMFSGDFGEVCGHGMDQIVMGDNRCTINELFEFDNREEAMDAYHATLEMREHLNNNQPRG